MAVVHRWAPISPLDDPQSLSDGELTALHEVWMDVKGDLEDRGVIPAFNLRLQREWAIELGIIEKAYTLDRGTTEVLIERGINADLIPHSATDRDPVIVASLIRSHEEVLEGMFAFVKDERPLTTGYIKQLHAALLQHQETLVVMDPTGRLSEQPLAKGAYKLQPNNPTRQDGEIHPYCPPEHVASEMDNLVRFYHDSFSSTPIPEVASAWLHHRFTQIHPFADGNGRVARALASLVFLKAGWFPLVISRDDRVEYIDALETADSGNLWPLVDLFVRVQRRTLVNLMKARDSVAPPETVDQAVSAAREVLRHRKALNNSAAAYATAERLRGVTEGHIQKLSAEFRHQIQEGEGINLFLAQSPVEDEVIIAAANQAGYEANLREYNANYSLRIGNPVTASIAVCFHGIGRAPHGLILALVFLQLPGQLRIAGAPFQTNYKEPPEQALTRFGPWIEARLAAAVSAWTEFL